MNPGDTISRYRIVGRIGKGGMGVVYRAEDTRLRRPVALKFVPRESLDERSKMRLLNEARAAAVARHPHICPIHDIEEADGEIFIVMAYIEGETLSRRISRGPLDPGQALEIAAQVASGLACAHGLGVIHRDVKSSNIMIDPAGHAWIMDFGLALAPEGARITAEGASVGTPDYMSPEQAQGREVDARTDLWSLGVVLFEMLTGRLPFRREHRAALVHAILSDPIPTLDAAPEIQAIVARALVRDPDGRWPTASAMYAAIRGAQGAPSATATEYEETKTIIGAAPRKRSRVAAAVAAVLLLAGGGFGGYKYLHRAPVPRHIAIMPFQVEGDPAIPNGVDEVLTSALASQTAISIVPSSDLRARKISDIDAVRKTHGVTQALLTTVKPSGPNVEFTFTLLDAATKKPVVPAQTVIYDPGKPLASRDQTVGRVARMLGVDPPAPTVVKAADPKASDAFSAYLEGRGALARYDIPGNTDKAILAFEKATREDPKYALAYVGLAEAYWRRSRAEADPKALALASQDAEYAVQLDNSLAPAHAILGSVYRDLDRKTDAVRELQRATQLAPANAEAPRQLADLYKKSGRFDDAEKLYVRSTQARPVDWYGFMLLGFFYFERQRYPEAESALQHAASLAPDNDLVRTNLGVMYSTQGKYQDAIAQYQKVLALRSSAHAYAALAEAFFHLGRYPQAVTAGETAIELSPEDYRYWGNLGVYYKWTPGAQAKSEPSLRRAVELARKSAETNKLDYAVHANLAEYHARLGDLKDALAEIDRIPETARAPYVARIALVYELAGRRAQAVAYIRASLKSPQSLRQIKDDPDLAPLLPEVNAR